MTGMIDSDSLGSKGEQRFGELCADASLFCNKSDRDRAGWDFLVDFPLDDTQSLSFDHRKAPLSCHVQVKTTWETSPSVSMKLNMAERLAKELKPSFICVFRVSRDRELKFTDAFLIHVAGDRLGKILKRLRKEQAKLDGEPLNRKVITFKPLPSERIDLTGVALRRALELHCGTDIHRYADEKRKQMQKLGFEGRPHEVTVTFEGMNESQLLDAFLGLTSQIPVTNLETFETRFGIALQDIPPTRANISIQPHVSDTCTIAVRSAGNALPAVFAGDVFHTPPIGTTLHRILIRSELFNLVIDLIEGQCSYKFDFLVDGKSCTPSTWANFWRMLSAFDEKKGVIEIQLKSGAVPLELPFLMEGGDSVLDDGLSPREGVHVFECFSKILQHAGVSPESTFEYGKILRAGNNIAILAEILNGTQPTISVSESSLAAAEAIPSGHMIAANAFRVGSVVIASYATVFAEAAFENGQLALSFREFQHKKIRIIETGRPGYESFLANAQRTEGIEHVLII